MQAEAALERATTAEQAKIELTLALAEAAEARVNDVDTHSASAGVSPRQAGTPTGLINTAAASAAADSKLAAQKVAPVGDGPNTVESLDSKGTGWGGVDGLADGIDSVRERTSSTTPVQARSALAAGTAVSSNASLQEVPAGSTVVKTSEMEALLTRAEESELAAAVQTRRAAAAESEVDALKKRLEQAEKQVRELGWQIQMLALPMTIGGKQSGRGGPGAGGGPGGGWFGDMLGCGANFVRKP